MTTDQTARRAAYLLGRHRAENPGAADTEDFAAGFSLGFQLGSEKPEPLITDSRLDNDTDAQGTGGPYEYWESDYTGLVHVLWSAKHRGLTLVDDADAIASRIMQARWFAAARAAAAEPRMLTHRSEVNALAARAVIRSEQGAVWERQVDGPGAVWAETGSNRKHRSADIALPAEVLHDPERVTRVLAGPREQPADHDTQAVRERIVAEVFTAVRQLPAYGMAGDSHFEPDITRDTVLDTIRELIEPTKPQTPRATPNRERNNR